MKVFFVRHGESTGNAGITSFDLSKLELTALGQAQAESTALRWQQRPTLIALSPYLRTHLTAQPTINRFPDVPVEILLMEEFTYLEPSRWNGTSRQARLPHIESYWGFADPEFCDGPGAESFQTLLDRVGRTLAHFEALAPEALVFAFSHGQFMQAAAVMVERQGAKLALHEKAKPVEPKGLFSGLKRATYEQALATWRGVRTRLEKRWKQLESRLKLVGDYMRKNAAYEPGLSKGEQLAEKKASQARPDLASAVRQVMKEEQSASLQALRAKSAQRQKTQRDQINDRDNGRGR